VGTPVFDVIEEIGAGEEVEEENSVVSGAEARGEDRGTEEMPAILCGRGTPGPGEPDAGDSGEGSADGADGYRRCPKGCLVALGGAPGTFPWPDSVDEPPEVAGSPI